MRLDLFVKLKYESSTIYYSVVGLLDILRVTYCLTSITMTDPQTSDMRQIGRMMSALPLTSARLSKL